MHELAQRILDKDARALARGMRLVDDRVAGFREILVDLYPHTGKAFVLGITGNPGAGKSTLTDRLVAAYRAAGKTVGVLCVDPTSPYTGGAILGDRIRMARHSTDPGVFIRSVATRGHLGGLSRSARDMVRLLDAFGFDAIFVETVGVGQDELEITRTASTTLVVMAPGMGDEVQAIKAGIMETADLFAVNKADRDGADSTVRDIELMISLGNESILALSKNKGHATHTAADGHVRAGGPTADERWQPPIVKCVATRDQGTTELVAAIERHRVWSESTEAGAIRRRERVAEELRGELREAFIDRAMAELAPDIDTALERIMARTLDPYRATEQLLALFRRG
jgi:LAO/AO transport system kinase